MDKVFQLLQLHTLIILLEELVPQFHAEIKERRLHSEDLLNQRAADITTQHPLLIKEDGENLLSMMLPRCLDLDFKESTIK